jgi:hypothetical protein
MLYMIKKSGGTQNGKSIKNSEPIQVYGNSRECKIIG